MKPTSRTDTTGPWRLQNIFRIKRPDEAGSTFFSRELDTAKDAAWKRLDEMDKEKRENALYLLGFLDMNLSRHRADLLLLDEIVGKSEIMQAFPDLFGAGKVEGIFTYRRDEQDKEHERILGYANYIQTEKGKCYVVGLSLDTLEHGLLYATGIFLHELAHVAMDRDGGDISAHGPEFTEAVKRLVEQYEARTGKHIPEDATWIKAT